MVYKLLFNKGRSFTWTCTAPFYVNILLGLQSNNVQHDLQRLTHLIISRYNKIDLNSKQNPYDMHVVELRYVPTPHSSEVVNNLYSLVVACVYFIARVPSEQTKPLWSKKQEKCLKVRREQQRVLFGEKARDAPPTLNPIL